MNNSLLKAAIIGLSTITIVASGTSGSTSSTSVIPLNSDGTNKTLSELAKEKDVVFVVDAIVVDTADDEGTSTTLSDAKLKFEMAGDGEYKVTINGKFYDIEKIKVRKAGSFVDLDKLFTSEYYLQSLKEFANYDLVKRVKNTEESVTNKYSDVIVLSATEYDGDGKFKSSIDYYADIGSAPQNFPTENTTTYKGFAFSEVRYDTGSKNYKDEPIYTSGGMIANVQLNADFGTQKISGSMSNFYEPSEKKIVAGSVEIEETSLSEEGFSANLSGTIISRGDVKGKLGGRFYGDNAEEAAGTFNLNNTSGENIIAGGFAVNSK